MSKFSKIFGIASTVGKPFIPGIGGSILDAVNLSINNSDDPGNAEGLKAVAANDHEQDQAILALTHVVADLQERLKAVETK